MAASEQVLLTYAREIKKYCMSRSRKCEINCIFFRHSECECGLEEGSPYYWLIPRKGGRAKDGRE